MIFRHQFSVEGKSIYLSQGAAAFRLHLRRHCLKHVFVNYFGSDDLLTYKQTTDIFLLFSSI